MANKRGARSQRKGAGLTGAVKRAANSSKRAQKDMKSSVKPLENFVRADRNGRKDRSQASEKLGQKVLVFVGTAEQKKQLEKRVKPAKVRGQVAKTNPRTVTAKVGRSMTERVFGPMTRRQAAQVSDVMRDLPSTKLPPRL